MVILGRNLTIEYRTGVGIDLEFCDSRPVWVYNTTKQSIETMPFQGTILHLPLCIISFGRVYQEVFE